MKLPLKQAVQKHVQARRLDDSQLAALTALQRTHGRPVPAASGHRHWWYAVPGAVAATLLAVVLLLPRSTDTPPGDRLVAGIAAEVVHNHLHRKPLEVRSDRLEAIRGYFTRLDFVPVTSRHLDSIGLELMGGRYCSLQGVTAAQLRFKAMGSDEVHSLYQVGYDPAVFKTLPDFDRGETPLSTWSGGIKVTLWVEKGILFALTQEQEAQH